MYSDEIREELGIKDDKEWHTLCNQATKILHCYVEYRRNAGYKHYKCPVPIASGSTFLKCAKLYWEKGIDFRDFINWAGKSTTQFIPPNNLTSKYLIARYLESHDPNQKLMDANRVCVSNTQLIEAYIKKGKKLDEIVMDPTLNLNPLFVYCTLVDAKSELASTFERSALLCLRDHPEYRSSMIAKYIPPSLV